MLVFLYRSRELQRPKGASKFKSIEAIRTVLQDAKADEICRAWPHIKRQTGYIIMKRAEEWLVDLPNRVIL